MKRAIGAVTVMTCLAGATGFAQQGTPTAAPSRAPEEHQFKPPADAHTSGGLGAAESLPGDSVVSGPKTVGSTEPIGGSGTSANAGALRNLQAIDLHDGVAHVRLDGVDQTVRAGDVLGGDVVRSIEPNRIVLARSEGPGRTATVIVTFDAQGKARARVFTTQDTKPLDAPAAH
jgi:hypothetical protein